MNDDVLADAVQEAFDAYFFAVRTSIDESKAGATPARMTALERERELLWAEFEKLRAQLAARLAARR